MNEEKAINRAYAKQLRSIFVVFFDGVVSGSPAAAEDRFRQGLTMLRFTRDRALKLVSSGDAQPDESPAPNT